MRKLILAAAVACTAVSANAAPTLWGGNGHYYEYIGGGFSWQDARAAASASSFGGQQGYLVTITSAEENTFLAGLTSSIAWTGGSDEGTEGTWLWMDGPEAGTAFWINGVTQTYSNWNNGEPNNAGNEDYLHFNFGGSGGWNDVYPTYGSGYIVEYGGLSMGVPEPSTWALLILGFGAVGGALRRSRKVRTALTYA